MSIEELEALGWLRGPPDVDPEDVAACEAEGGFTLHSPDGNVSLTSGPDFPYAVLAVCISVESPDAPAVAEAIRQACAGHDRAWWLDEAASE